jgi:hypothetical protein
VPPGRGNGFDIGFDEFASAVLRVFLPLVRR